MSLLSRILGRPKKVNVLSTIDADTGMYRIEHDTPVQWRRAQSVPDDLRERLVAICEADADVIACSFLDVRDPKLREEKLFVSLELNHPGALHRVAPQLQSVFRDFPQYTGNYFIADQPFGDLPPEAAAYRRAV